MKWEDVEIALTFLDDERDEIVLQVPYHCDITKVVDYIVEKHQELKIFAVREREILTQSGKVIVEAVSDGRAGMNFKGPYFMIARSDGDHGVAVVDYNE